MRPCQGGSWPSLPSEAPIFAQYSSALPGWDGLDQGDAWCGTPDGAGWASLRLPVTHETPGDSRVRALPSPYRARALVSPGVSCRRARSHARPGASTGARPSLWTMLGTSRAGLLTAAGTAVDNRGTAAGVRNFFALIDLP